MALSPKEVKKAISSDLKSREISHATASSLLGISRQSFSNFLYTPKYFSRAMALRYNDAFGYAIPFLISGEGALFQGDDASEVKISPQVAFGAEMTYIDLLEKHIALSTDILGALCEHCNNERIKQILSSLMGRGILVSQARKILIFTKDESGDERPLFDLLTSINNILDPYDKELKKSLRALKGTAEEETEHGS